MNVLVYPNTHPHASLIRQSLYSILVPHYLPQTISPDVLAARENPWHLACGLLVLLAAPERHAGVREYAENGGRILALGVNASRSQGPFDTSVLRLADGKASLHLSFPSQATTLDAIVNYDENKTEVKRTSSASLDLGDGTRVLGRYANDETLAGALSQSGAVALWSCAPPLPEHLLIPTLSALGLQFNPVDDQQPGPRLLPQVLLAHPKKWNALRPIMHTLFPDRDLEAAFSMLTIEDTSRGSAVDSAVLSDSQDVFQFHFVRAIPSANSSPDHPILNLLSEVSNKGPIDVIVTTQPLSTEQERLYTPLFSPSIFFAALDEFRHFEKTEGLLFGDVLLYGEVITSTQTMLDRNPKFLRALPSPLLSLATKQVAGRGRGENAWLSPAGSMLVSLKLTVPLKKPGSVNDPGSIRPTNLVFIQYLFALAVVEACEALDPSNSWASKVKLKWPNDIYGEFPAGGTSKGVELRKLGGILVNTSFCGSTADVIVGCGLNILNEPPIGSLAQLETLTRGQGTSSTLTVEQVTAAVLTKFERIWSVFVAEDSFRPFINQYTQSWLHSGQAITLTTVTPHTTVRIVGITLDHGLLRTEPLSGGQYIDLQPDSNSFDMLKGLIKIKATWRD